VGKANAMMSLTGHTSAAWGPIYFVLRRSRASWATKTLQVDGCIVDIYMYISIESYICIYHIYIHTYTWNIYYIYIHEYMYIDRQTDRQTDR
jgi:hypothetical protein